MRDDQSPLLIAGSWVAIFLAGVAIVGGILRAIGVAYRRSVKWVADEIRSSWEDQ